MENKLYRICSKTELISFIENKVMSVVGTPRQYISLSESLDKDNIDYFVESNDNLEIYDLVLLTFDKNKLIGQGCFQVQYNTHFMYAHPEVYEHFNGAKIQDDSIEDIEFTSECFSHEKEWVTKQIIFESGVLINIDKINTKDNSFVKPDKDIFELLTRTKL